MVTCIAKGAPVVLVSCFVFCTCFGFVCLFVCLFLGTKRTLPFAFVSVNIKFCAYSNTVQEFSRANPVSGKSSVMTFIMTPKTREFSFY